jgi:hypothetical protein
MMMKMKKIKEKDTQLKVSLQVKNKQNFKYLKIVKEV